MTIEEEKIKEIPKKNTEQGAYIGYMNQEQYDEYVKNKVNGWDKFTNKIKTIFK